MEAAECIPFMIGFNVIKNFFLKLFSLRFCHIYLRIVLRHCYKKFNHFEMMVEKVYKT